MLDFSDGEFLPDGQGGFQDATLPAEVRSRAVNAPGPTACKQTAEDPGNAGGRLGHLRELAGGGVALGGGSSLLLLLAEAFVALAEKLRVQLRSWVGAENGHDLGRSRVPGVGAARETPQLCAPVLRGIFVCSQQGAQVRDRLAQRLAVAGLGRGGKPRLVVAHAADGCRGAGEQPRAKLPD